MFNFSTWRMLLDFFHSSALADGFVFGDFNRNHKDSLTYSDGTNRLVIFISDHYTQTLTFGALISGCSGHSPARFG